MISVFDRYVIRVLVAATCVTAVSLTMIVLLTQSIRFLELVISSDASSYYFMIMMGLAVPKFLEAILPIAFSIGIVFACYRMILDREIIVMYATGMAAHTLARPFLFFTAFMMALQFILSGWLAPVAIENLQSVRTDIKGHYATLLFREGVFNTIGPGVTAYVHDRGAPNELRNVMIHDEDGTISQGKATTIVAQRGLVNIDQDRQQILVYDGTQYEEDLASGVISRLDFKQYTLDIPTEKAAIGARWREPDERTINELLLPSSEVAERDQPHLQEFRAEAHRRLSTPFLYLSYCTVPLAFLLLGVWDRRRQGHHVVRAGVAIIAIQALYIVCYNLARENLWLVPLLYGLAFLPGLIGFALLRLSKPLDGPALWTALFRRPLRQD